MMRSAGPSKWKHAARVLAPLVTGDRRAMARAAAFQALRILSAEDRGLVLCWFCSRCGAHIAPGEHVHDPGVPDWPRCAR